MTRSGRGCAPSAGTSPSRRTRRRSFTPTPITGRREQWEELAPEAAAARAQAAAEEAALRARLIAAGLDGDAHRRGAPPRPGIPTGPAAGFGQGQPLDALAPSTALSGLADEASGEDRAFTDVTDDELMGLIGARQRLAGRQQWELLTAVAEFLRRRPDPSSPPPAAGGMPAVWDEHAGADLAVQLHLTPGAAEGLLSLAHDLAVKLPGTAAALRDGIIDLDKARTIAWYCFALTAAEARAAEAVVLGLAGVEEMTWGMIRDRIARAVIEVNPEAARKRRERAAKDKRVEVVAEQSGNCQLAGRELPPAAVLAADENLTARARQLRAAGVPGGMDELRALAYLGALGGLDPLDYAVPRGGTGDGTRGDRGDGRGDRGRSRQRRGRRPWRARPGRAPARRPRRRGGGAGEIPAGFAARVNLTVPLATLLGLAERPGRCPGPGRWTPRWPATWPPPRPAAPAPPGASPSPAPTTGPSPTAAAVPRPAGTDAMPPPGRPATGRFTPPAMTTARREPAPSGWTSPPSPGQPARRHHHRRGGPGVRAGEPGRAVRSPAPGERARPGGPAAAPDRDPERLLHLPALPPPRSHCDYEHSTAYEKGGRTCLCHAGPVCRHNHRDKQAPGWRLEHAGARGWFRWRTPSGRTYLSRPTQYPD